MILKGFKLKLPCNVLNYVYKNTCSFSTTGIIFKKSSALFDNLDINKTDIQTSIKSNKKSNFEKWQENPNTNPFTSPINQMASYIENFQVKKAIHHYKQRDFVREVLPVLQF